MAERNDAAAKLQKWKAAGDQAVVARILADLASLDKEIALVSKQPVYEIKESWPKQAVKATPAAQAVTQESPPSETDSVDYESWDVFRNFGTKKERHEERN